MNVYSAENWKKEKAIFLFDQGIKMSTDNKYGGLVYGYSSEGKFSNSKKYFWAQAEALAAAWRLYKLTNDNKYYEFYISLRSYCWENFIDHEYGAWFHILSREGKQFGNIKSPLGKTDYHTMGACWDIINIMKIN